MGLMQIRIWKLYFFENNIFKYESYTTSVKTLIVKKFKIQKKKEYEFPNEVYGSFNIIVYNQHKSKTFAQNIK